MFNDFRNPSTKNNLSYLNQIDGLTYIPNFISLETHNFLWESIEKEEWSTELKRRVQHYGWKYNYKFRKIDKSMFIGQLPDWIYSIKDLNRYIDPDQLIVNEYLPGQGISNHTDCEPCFDDTICSISLGSPVIMDLINIQTKTKVSMLLEPRSLLIISGESRYNWTHGIPGRLKDNFNSEVLIRGKRISLTFRKVII